MAFALNEMKIGFIVPETGPSNIPGNTVAQLEAIDPSFLVNGTLTFCSNGASGVQCLALWDSENSQWDQVNAPGTAITI